MIWKHSKNDDLIISSEMSLDALTMKRSVLPMDSWRSATVKSFVCYPLHPAFRLLKEHCGLENWGHYLRGIGARLEFVVIFMLYSLVVCLKRKSTIILSGSKSLFLYNLVLSLTFHLKENDCVWTNFVNVNYRCESKTTNFVYDTHLNFRSFFSGKKVRIIHR